jgi:hypothetical protein
MSAESVADSLAESDVDIYECCECNKKDEFSDLQDAYDNGWFQYDEANYCPDHTADAIEECDTDGLVINWSDNFGPCEIVGKVIEILHPEINKNIIAELYRFLETMGYAAPEISDQRFWGDGGWSTDFTQICKSYFEHDARVKKIYNSAVEKYNKNGFSK